MKRLGIAVLLLGVTIFGIAINARAENKKIVLVAGKPSHGPGAHEFNAGTLLLKSCLDKVPGITVVVYTNGWPADKDAFKDADAVVLYMDGGDHHPAIQDKHLDQLHEVMKRGAGLACIHFAVEVPKDKGGYEFLNWIGGYFETYWSVNPTWEADFKELPKHPITRGVKPFKILDEWYYHMRFQEEHVTPILSAVPPDETREHPDDAHGGNEFVRARKGMPEVTAWAYDRPDGGRGFGFTGAHFHKNWGDENFRRLVLNAILWIAHVEVPEDGVQSTVTPEELEKNLDPKGQKKKAAGAPPKQRILSAQAATAGFAVSERAKESLKSFTVAPGLEVSVFASEPMLRNPTDMDIDERGRVWITEGVNYRSTFQPWGTLQPAGDKVIVLEDTDGDGVADKQTVFYQGPDINSALGICVFGNKVIVSRSPNVFVLTDTDGDGKADKKEILFSGIGGVDHDHGVHAFTFGPDGKLYFCFGNLGGQLKDRDGKLVHDIEGNPVSNTGQPYRQGMVFRCNVDGSDVEVMAYNFRNNYEVAVDSFGTLWQSDNDDDGNRATRINYVMEHGNFGYTDELTGAGWFEKRTNLEKDIPNRHWHQNDPGVVPNLLMTGAGAPTGILVYEGNSLPETFRGQMIHADAGTRVVRSYPVQPDGAGYRADSVNILSTPDTWFRPSDVCIAPDGSLYVADWNDATVGGHDMADRDVSKMTGRVYRVAAAGAKPVVPKLDLKTAAGCVAALQSPNLSTRYLAWTKLQAMQHDGEKELLKVWNGKGDPRMRARALYVLAEIKGEANKYVRQAVKDKNPDLRITGLRIAREKKLDVISYVKMLVNDPSAQVRRECAIALRHNPSPEAPKLWAELAMQHNGKDRWYLEALGIGADKQEDKFFDAWLAKVGKNWNTPAGWDIVWRSRAGKSAELLAQIIMNPAAPESERARYMRAFDFIKGPEKKAALVDLLTMATSDKEIPDSRVRASDLERAASPQRLSPPDR